MNSAKIVESIRKTRLSNEELQLFKQSFVIVPYQVSGFIDYTNRGASNYVVSPNDFETFKRIWTGNDACNLVWKNSIRLVQNTETKEMEVKFQLGEVFLGLMETNYNENNVSVDKSFSDYTSQEVQSTLTFRVHKYFNITDYYHFMFYKIPEVSGSTLYRIENIQKDFIGNELAGYVITFKSVNQDFANTGRARQQNIMPNSPGQGYLECIVEDSTWPERLGDKFKELKSGIDYYVMYDRYITADYKKVKNNPVRKMIVRLLGNGILNSVVCVGRPVLLGDSLEKYRPQRLIFPYSFNNPTTPNLFHTQNNSNNFYFGDFKPTLEYFKDLMESIKDSLTPVNKWNYQGWLKYNYNDLVATNPKTNNGYKYDLFGYLDNSTNPTIQIPWEFSTPEKIIDTSGNYGLEQLYKIGGNKKIWDHMFDNFWTQKQFKVLPMNIYSTTTFGWTLSSAISQVSKGGILSVIFGGMLALIGITGTLAGKLLTKTLTTFRGLISAPLIDYNNKLFENTGNGNNIPFNLIDSNNSDSPSSIFFDGSTLNIGIEAKLTDLITCDRAPDKVLSTVNIGQDKLENGEYIFDTKETFLLKGDCKLLETYDNYSGFIIDSFKIQAVFNGEISVEFLDINNEVVWSGVYQSEGKWTNSLREIWTEKNCSVFGRENVFYIEPVPYPKEIPDPPPTFTKAIKKVITDTKMKEEYYYAASGGGHDLSCFNGYGNILISSGGFSQSKTQIANTGGYNLMENITKEELLQLYSHISFDYIQARSKKITNMTFFELFSTPDNKKTMRFFLSDEYFNDIGVSMPPVPFPTHIITLYVKTQIEIDVTVYYEDNTLKLKWEVVNSNHRNSTYFVVPNNWGPVYLIFYSWIGGTARANINSITIYPK